MMTNQTLRTLVAMAIVLLVVNEFLGWLAGLWGATAGLIGAVIVTGVSLFCGRMARVGVGNVGWFLVPTLLFTVLPTAAKVWNYFTVEETWLEKLWDQLPFILGFLAPIGALLVVYVQLRKRDLIYRVYGT